MSNKRYSSEQSIRNTTILDKWRYIVKVSSLFPPLFTKAFTKTNTEHEPSSILTIFDALLPIISIESAFLFCDEHSSATVVLLFLAYFAVGANYLLCSFTCHLFSFQYIHIHLNPTIRVVTRMSLTLFFDSC